MYCKKNNFSVLSGNLLCVSCYLKAMKIKTKLYASDFSESSSSLEETVALTSSFARKQVVENTNKKIKHNFPDISSLKLLGISQKRSSSGLQATKRKLKQIVYP